MLITVTQEDINQGIKGSCRHCPIALAIEKLVPDTVIEVGVDEICVGEETLWTTPLLAEFITDFDKSIPVEPFSFELNYES